MAEDSKNKDKRIEEKERLDAEVERSLAVARVKQAHKQIEDTEKMRKRSVVMSICERLMYLASMVNTLNGGLLEKDAPLMIVPGVYQCEQIQNYVRMYESIRYDLQKILDINNEDFEKLFPRIAVKFGERFMVVSCLSSLVDQLIDMRIYCNRLLM